MESKNKFFIQSEVDGNVNLLVRIVDALKQYVINTKEEPTSIFLTMIDECDLYCLGTNQVGQELVNLLMRYGTREGLRIFSNGRLGGFLVVWDADSSRVE